MRGIVDQNANTGLLVQLPRAPGNGAYRALFTVPGDLSLDLWFSLVAVDNQGGQTCQSWASNDGHNFHFDIAAP